jgi:hypothetical protein
MVGADPGIPSECPLCGLNNQCGMVAGSPDPCWCSGVTIGAEILARIPEALKNRTCLCPSCARMLESIAGSDQH